MVAQHGLGGVPLESNIATRWAMSAMARAFVDFDPQPLFLVAGFLPGRTARSTAATGPRLPSAFRGRRAAARRFRSARGEVRRPASPIGILLGPGWVRPPSSARTLNSDHRPSSPISPVVRAGRCLHAAHQGGRRDQRDAALAIPPSLRGFTVDDALISARYAARPRAWRRLPLPALHERPGTDGVTPLGWPLPARALRRPRPARRLLAAKILGVDRLDDRRRRARRGHRSRRLGKARATPPLLLALGAARRVGDNFGMGQIGDHFPSRSPPASGTLGHARASAAFTENFRRDAPRMIPWAAWSPSPRRRGSATRIATAVGSRAPAARFHIKHAVAIALIRLAISSAAPLALPILAKPSDPEMPALATPSRASS
jgi:hypothetical protein